MNESDKKLSCRDTTWLVSSARDTPLDAGRQRLLDEHIASCPACQVASRQFAELFDQLDALFARDQDKKY